MMWCTYACTRMFTRTYDAAGSSRCQPLLYGTGASGTPYSTTVNLGVAVCGSDSTSSDVELGCCLRPLCIAQESDGEGGLQVQ